MMTFFAPGEGLFPAFREALPLSSRPPRVLSPQPRAVGPAGRLKRTERVAGGWSMGMGCLGRLFRIHRDEKDGWVEIAGGDWLM